LGGKFRDFFPENWVIDHLKMGKTPHPTPHTPHPATRKNFLPQTLVIDTELLSRPLGVKSDLGIPQPDKVKIVPIP
jgi:hypothetical protein